MLCYHCENRMLCCHCENRMLCCHCENRMLCCHCENRMLCCHCENRMLCCHCENRMLCCHCENRMLYCCCGFTNIQQILSYNQKYCWKEYSAVFGYFRHWLFKFWQLARLGYNYIFIAAANKMASLINFYIYVYEDEKVSQDFCSLSVYS